MGGASAGALGRQAGFVRCLGKEMSAKLCSAAPFLAAVTTGGGMCSSYY